MIKKIIEIWKTGWGVVGRLFLFTFAMTLITAPFQLLPEREYIALDESGFHLDGVLAIAIALTIVPFFAYAASRMSKEFIVPRNVQNEWIEKSDQKKI